MKSVMPRAFPTLSQNRVVVLRIEPLCFSLLPGAHPSPEVKDIASDSLTAIALSPFAAGELQGSGAAMSAGVCLRGLLKVNDGLTWGMAPCGNPPPSGRVSGGRAVKDKNRNPEGTPDFFLDGAAAARGRGKKINSQYVNIAGWTGPDLL
ncbi:hypothetical protein T040_21840 [Salmonella enterica subsp. enterica serovar Senftenberg]|nr:hypothetical protein [Salmonella enterica subsp. enterica serovar Senftenberg]EEJ9532903.1 hypothetical protein [Salmonella enterica subsp. enterica serovar Senftenberg]